ncbi:MAG TPA: TonB-dependent receptor, partial [Bacteroidales bacterium]|nr:TonB-dependent receptor [Bacteroidales bacterium]
MKHLKHTLAILLFMLIPVLALAQGSTTSSMSGQITDSQGAPQAGATIVATHVPSGSIYGATANAQGLFSIQGMRPGGPYKVEVSFIGYSKETFTDINLSLGEIFGLNVGMTESSTELNVVTVVGAKPSKFNMLKTGATTNISAEQMTMMPTINRNIGDISRISPYANGMSFSGGDGRSTNFTVDGSNFNNNFGLSSNLPGGGNPISLDAIEEVQVVIAPFDVRQTNFIGGGINAITKSGTNTYKATAYTYYTNQNMRGNKIGDHDFGDRTKESNSIYGFTVGGPIIKNKLFFFGNLEYEKTPQQVIRWRASTNGVSDQQTISRVTESDLQTVSDFLRDNYGYETGSYSSFPADESNLKYLARLDWNITDAHKLSVRFNHTKNTAWNPPNGNSTDGGYRDSRKNRVGEFSFSYANSMYSMDNIVNSGSLELNSRFSNNISNQLLVTYSDIKDVRGSTSSPFPFIDIMSGDIATGVDALAPYISAGYELFTWNNGVKNKIITATDNLTYSLDAHKITAGVSFEYQMAD